MEIATNHWVFDNNKKILQSFQRIDSVISDFTNHIQLNEMIIQSQGRNDESRANQERHSGSATAQ